MSRPSGALEGRAGAVMTPLNAAIAGLAVVGGRLIWPPLSPIWPTHAPEVGVRCPYTPQGPRQPTEAAGVALLAAQPGLKKKSLGRSSRVVLGQNRSWDLRVSLVVGANERDPGNFCGADGTAGLPADEFEDPGGAAQHPARRGRSGALA